MFIYVFDKETRDALIERGYSLLKSDNTRCVYVFDSKGGDKFALGDIKYAYSDILTF